MSKIIKAFLWTGLAIMALTVVSPAPASARDRYWNNYWSWYDRDYRPYHYRQYYQPRGNHYGDGYYSNGSPYNYGRTYYGGRRGGVQVGPVRVYWH